MTSFFEPCSTEDCSNATRLLNVQYRVIGAALFCKELLNFLGPPVFFCSHTFVLFPVGLHCTKAESRIIDNRPRI